MGIPQLQSDWSLARPVTTDLIFREQPYRFFEISTLRGVHSY